MDPVRSGTTKGHSGQSQCQVFSYVSGFQNKYEVIYKHNEVADREKTALDTNRINGLNVSNGLRLKIAL